jgi:putative transcriptional regulator
VKTRLKELRTSAGYTQQYLADLVHVSARTIISIEKEQYNPSLMLAYRLAQVFHTTIEDLCCLADNEQLEQDSCLSSHSKQKPSD